MQKLRFPLLKTQNKDGGTGQNMAWNALLATRNSDLFNSFDCFSQQMEFIVLVCLKWCWLKAVNSSDACIEHYSYDNKMFYLRNVFCDFYLIFILCFWLLQGGKNRLFVFHRIDCAVWDTSLHVIWVFFWRTRVDFVLHVFFMFCRFSSNHFVESMQSSTDFL